MLGIFVGGNVVDTVEHDKPLELIAAVSRAIASYGACGEVRVADYIDDFTLEIAVPFKVGELKAIRDDIKGGKIHDKGYTHSATKVLEDITIHGYEYAINLSVIGEG